MIYGLGVAVYLGIMLYIGYRCKDKIKTAEDYLVAGRGLGLALSTATLTSCFLGGAMVVALPGISYSLGLWNDEFLWGVNSIYGGFILCLFLLATFIMPNLWRLKQVSIGDFFYSRYGRTAGVMSSVINCGAFVFWVAVQIIVFSKIVTPLLGWSYELSIIIALAVICAYTLMGGLWAISVTDIVQVTIVIIGLIILFPVALNTAGGWSAVMEAVPAEMLKVFPQVHTADTWLAWIAVFLLVGLGGLPAPDVTQRAYAAKSPKISRQSGYITMVIAAIVGAMTIMLGYVGLVLVQNGVIPAELLAEDPELIIPVMFKQIMPVPLVVLFLGAALAAVMSAADSALLALSAILSKNIYKDIFNPDCSQESLLKASRTLVVICGIIGGLIALYFPYAGQLVAFAFDLMMACLLAPLVLGIFWKKANGYGALAAMITGALFRVVAAAVIEGVSFDGITYPAHWYYYVLITPVISFTTMWIVSSLTQGANEPLPLMSTEGEVIVASLKV
jgi:solute:Na+ symporter, SSS family